MLSSPTDTITASNFKLPMATALESENSNIDAEKAEMPPHKKGGWMTFPFLSGLLSQLPLPSLPHILIKWILSNIPAYT
jgi:hypothetical protein